MDAEAEADGGLEAEDVWFLGERRGEGWRAGFAGEDVRWIDSDIETVRAERVDEEVRRGGDGRRERGCLRVVDIDEDEDEDVEVVDVNDVFVGIECSGGRKPDASASSRSLLPRRRVSAILLLGPACGSSSACVRVCRVRSSVVWVRKGDDIVISNVSTSSPALSCIALVVNLGST